MVFDDWRNGIPVAFFAISRMREQDLVPVLQALHKRVSKVKKDWSPSSIIVDNAQAEINTLGYVLLSTSITLISCIWFSVLTLSFVCRVVWPGAKIFLCLWHVRKAWAENAVRKIACAVERVAVLQLVGDIMYGTGCAVDDDPIDWATSQLDLITRTRPRSSAFMMYMNEWWRNKIPMWCVGARRIPHAGQNTNAALESYHSNLKNILSSSKERLVGRRMDWLIYHLTGDVVTHYWYGVQCKSFGFVRNKHHEGIVCSAIIRASAIPDTNVLICKDEDIAYVGSVNNRPKVWTIHSPDSVWAQCNCPVAREGMICKHTVKVFKMLHPDIHDGLIVRHAGTLHGVDRGTPMSQCYAKPPAPVTNKEQAPNPLQDITNCEPVDLDAETIGYSGLDDQPIGMHSQQPPDMCSQTIQSSASRNVNLSGGGPRNSDEMTCATVQKLYTSLTKNADTYPSLHAHLLADFKRIHGKQTELIARGDALSQLTSTPSNFTERAGDNSLKRRRSFLESTPTKKKNH